MSLKLKAFVKGVQLTWSWLSFLERHMFLHPKFLGKLLFKLEQRIPTFFIPQRRKVFVSVLFFPTRGLNSHLCHQDLS